MFSVLAIVLHAFTQSVRRVPSMYDQYMRRTIHEGMASEFDFDVVDSKTSTIVLLFSAAIIALLHIFVRDKQLENLLSLIIFLWYPTNFVVAWIDDCHTTHGTNLFEHDYV